MRAISYQHRCSLTPSELLILDLIDQDTAKGHRVFMRSIRWVADQVGRSLRTVQLAYQHFAQIGLVKRLDRAEVAAKLPFKVRCRSPLELLYRCSPETAKRAKSAPAQGEFFAPSEAIPPDPPIEEPEGFEEKKSDVVPTAGPEPGTTTIDPVPSPSPKTEPIRTPPAAEVAPVVQRAEAHFGPGQEGRVRAAVREFTLEWTRRAVEAAVKARATSWGYVLVTLRSWREEGGPPVEKRRQFTPEELAAMKARVLARLNPDGSMPV